MDNTTSTKYKLESGSIKVCTYIRSDAFSNRRIRFVIQDLYQNQPEFEEPIIWIENVSPNEGNTVSDVLDEYTEKYGEDAFIMCLADALMNPPKVGYNDMLEFADSMLGYVLNSYFYRVLFNRRMSRSYGNSYICLYSNTKTEDWIKDNMGKDKIIKNVLASNKIN